MFFTKIRVICLSIVQYSLCSACNQNEFEINGSCCLKCPPGYYVSRDCTAETDTECVPCSQSTFTDKPHGRRICNPCTTCERVLGLKTVKNCTASSDTVCGVLEGNYCVDPYEGGCRKAEKHTTCKPGQFIKRPGTEFTDTVCENCPENSYSDGSSTSCTPHTDCASRRLHTLRPGDGVSDSVSCMWINRETGHPVPMIQQI
ncbi:tumor necrosis factor receptor superfamily member 5-like isoform X1 [Arapaima gigas]